MGLHIVGTQYIFDFGLFIYVFSFNILLLDLLRYNLHTVKFNSVYISIGFDKCMQLYNHHHSHPPECSHVPLLSAPFPRSNSWQPLICSVLIVGLFQNVVSVESYSVQPFEDSFYHLA